LEDAALGLVLALVLLSVTAGLGVLALIEFAVSAGVVLWAVGRLVRRRFIPRSPARRARP
jgi:hypothetical protein